MRQTLINVSGNLADNASLTQIYSVGAKDLEASVFAKSPAPEIFSPEWLLFHEEKAPLIARETELARLHSFINDTRPFLWWAMYGPAGIGKSRLAHAFIADLPADWDGGFLAPDRTTIGGASAWEPETPTFWVIDYAAAHVEYLDNFLCVLARRFAESPIKIRILLLEREAAVTSFWWRNLIQKSGSAMPLLLNTLYAPPCPLAPLSEHTSTLLHALLMLAGSTEEFASQRLAALDTEQLASMTDSGRPLLVALTAAAIFARSDEQGTEIKLPRNVLDWYLGRELRLWRAKAADAKQFDAICHIVLFTTLASGFYLVTPKDEVRFMGPDGTLVHPSPEEIGRRIDGMNSKQLKTLSSAVQYPDVRACLAVIDHAGISKDKHWHLQPDMLGERLVQILLHPPIGDQEYLFDLPTFDERRLASVIIGAITTAQIKFWATLSRLDDSSVASILSLAGEYQGITMRYALIALRNIAEQRHRPLPAWASASIFTPSHFPDKFIPEIPKLIALLHAFTPEVDFTSAHGTKLLNSFEQAMQGDTFSKVGVWLIPFMLVIADIRGPALYKLAELYATHIEGYQFTRTREVVLGTRLLHQVSNRIIAEYQDCNSSGELGRASTLALQAKSLVGLYTTLATGAEGVMAQAEPVDVQDMARWLTETSVQFGYILLSGTVILGEPPTAESNRHAMVISMYGLQWTRKLKQPRNQDLLIRNYLAAALVHSPHEQSVLEMREQVMEKHREAEKQREFLDIATDGLRIAANHGDAISFSRVLEIIKRHFAWLADEMSCFDEEGRHYLVAIEKLLHDGQIAGAIAFLKQYCELAFLRNIGIDDPWLPPSFQSVASAAMKENRSSLEEIIQWLTDALNRATSQNVVMFCGHSIGFAALIAHQAGVAIELQGMEFSATEPDMATVRAGLTARGVDGEILGTVDRLIIGELVVKQSGSSKGFNILVPLIDLDADASPDDAQHLESAIAPVLVRLRRSAGSFAAFATILGHRGDDRSSRA